MLLVKRCKKLPKETTKHWAHVVDARAGPGTKSLKSVKNKNESKSNKSASKASDFKNNESNKNDQVRRVCERINDEHSLISKCSCSACEHNQQLDSQFKSRESRRLAERQQAKKSLSPKKFCAESASASSSGHSSDSSKQFALFHLISELTMFFSLKKDEEDEDYLSDYEQKSARVRTRNRSQSVSTSSSSKNSVSRSNDSGQNSLSQSTGRSRSKLQKTQSSTLKRTTGWQIQANDCTFLDLTYWQEEQVCCGVIFRNRSNNMVLIDPKQFKPCGCEASSNSKQAKQAKPSLSSEHSVESDLGDSGTSEMNDNECVVVTLASSNDLGNSSGLSSGISSASSDVCSVSTEEDEDDESSNSCGEVKSNDGKVTLVTTTTIHLPLKPETVRTFGVL